MGSVKKFLHQTRLPEREGHHSRLFVDVAENVHIHHREYRTVFSLDEYFEYAGVIRRSTDDIRSFLAQNPDYREQTYPTVVMVAGGKERQYQFLGNSPQPNVSKYLNDEFAIELQDEFVTDEIQIHYRDFRLALDRDRFRVIAQGFAEALQQLDEFEKTNEYVREYHPDHVIADFNREKSEPATTKLMGTVKMPLSKIQSPWDHGLEGWGPDKKETELLKKEFAEDGRFFPVLLSTEEDGRHLVIDGHHRIFAALELGLPDIDAVVTDEPWISSEKLRAADRLLKEYDRETEFKYNWSHILKLYAVYTSNRHYRNTYAKLIKKQSLFYRVARQLKRVIFGKRHIFKKFQEAHNL